MLDRILDPAVNPQGQAITAVVDLVQHPVLHVEKGPPDRVPLRLGFEQPLRGQQERVAGVLDHQVYQPYNSAIVFTDLFREIACINIVF